MLSFSNNNFITYQFHHFCLIIDYKVYIIRLFCTLYRSRNNYNILNYLINIIFNLHGLYFARIISLYQGLICIISRELYSFNTLNKIECDYLRWEGHRKTASPLYIILNIHIMSSSVKI